MSEILGKSKTIRELLSGSKYSIDYYQREYKWREKQVQELISDLTDKFIEDHDPSHERHEVEKYGHYFLGSIVISSKEHQKYVIDGQQRLTSLTLLLMYLRNLQGEGKNVVNIDELIFSEKYGKKTFNINVQERMACMEALFDNKPFDETGQPESVQNIVTRYREIDENFPEDLKKNSLPFFIDWLIDNVHLVEITAFSDDDAYRIFETMNDRGLSLSPTDMLKGFLLANIADGAKKISANNLWKKNILTLNDYEKDTDADFLKTWLRSQYSQSIRERKRGAKPEDFDKIGTEFHRWVKENKDTIGLNGSETYFDFISRDFNYFARQYMKLLKASDELVPGLERVLYNSQLGFTLQYFLLLTPLTPGDSDELANLKMRIVSIYLDILLAWRLWNFRSIAYSTMQYAMFINMREIRRASPKELAQKLYDRLKGETETFATDSGLYVHQNNRRFIHRILARITEYIEINSDMPSHYIEYVTGQGQERYEVEHIWANKPERHTDEFPEATAFTNYRNRFGGLLLLPKGFNQSYGDLEYTRKLPHYHGQNLLAKSLDPKCYDRSPGFVRFVEESGLTFTPHPEFKKADLDVRHELYRQIAQRIWDPELLLKEVGA